MLWIDFFTFCWVYNFIGFGGGEPTDNKRKVFLLRDNGESGDANFPVHWKRLILNAQLIETSVTNGRFRNRVGVGVRTENTDERRTQKTAYPSPC